MVTEVITVDGDDGYQRTTSGDWYDEEGSSGQSEIYGSAYEKTAGVRYQSLALVSTDVIDSATLEYVIEQSNGSVGVTWIGDDVDTAPVFANNDGPDQFTATTATVNETFAAVQTYSIDVAAILQEIIDRGGWNAGAKNVRFGTINHTGGANNYAKGGDSSGSNPCDLVYTFHAGVGASLSLPTEADITDTTVTVGCTTDDATGTMYYYISTSATAPSVSDLKDGTSSVKFGNDTSISIPQTFAVTGLTTDTTYYTYFLQNDTSDDSAILESGSWQTLGSIIISDTMTATVDEDDITTGGKKLVATITGDTFVDNASPSALVIESGDVSVDDDNVTTTTITFAIPVYADGDLVVVQYAMWSNGSSTEISTWFTGPNGETVTEFVAGEGAGTTHTVYIAVGYFIGDGANASPSNQSSTSDSSTRWSGAAIVVPAGEFDPAKPLSTAFGKDVSTANSTIPNFLTFNANSDDAGGRLLCFIGIDQANVTAHPTGWTELSGDTAGRTRNVLSIRTDDIDASESVTPPSDWTSGSNAWQTYAYIIRPAPATTDFDDARQAFIDGFNAGSSPTNGWNNEVRDKAAVTEVVRTSSTAVTWTVAAQSGYDISSQEEITATIPTTILTGGTLLATSPTFTIDEVGGGGGPTVPVLWHHYSKNIG